MRAAIGRPALALRLLLQLGDAGLAGPGTSGRGVWTVTVEVAAANVLLHSQRARLTVSGSTSTPWSGPFRDHGLNLPLCIENPRNFGFRGPGAPIFGFGLADLARKG